MDPHVIFDCQKVLPNRYALTLAAAARCRSLARGAEPRLGPAAAGPTKLALHEIAQGAFTPDELAPYLIEPGEAPRRLSCGSKLPLCGGGDAAAPVSCCEEAVH